KAVKREISARTRNPDWSRFASDIAPPFPIETPRGATRERRGRAGVLLVDEVDQLPEPAERAVVERQDQPRKVGELVELSWHRTRLEPCWALEDVGELVLKVGDLSGLQRPVQPEDQVVPHDPRRGIDAIEARHLGDSLAGRIEDPEQRGLPGTAQSARD